MRPTTASAALLCLFAAALPAAAQQHDHAHAGGVFPPGWQGRVDRPTQDVNEVRFMAMGEGFHVITGPHVVLWHPDRTATGEYVARATFTQQRAPERREGYGLVVGGRDLDQPGQDYLYFLIRHDGHFMVRHRAGDEVHTLAEWTASDAIDGATADAPGTNTLAIEARPDEVGFLVNGTEVFTLARAEHDGIRIPNTDGLVGLRVGHHLDVRVSDFVIEPRP
jgi:hypothetical protein